MKQQIAELSKEFYVLLQENYFLHYNARYPSMNLVFSTLHDEVAIFGRLYHCSTVFVPKIDRQFDLYRTALVDAYGQPDRKISAFTPSRNENLNI